MTPFANIRGKEDLYYQRFIFNTETEDTKIIEQ